MSSTAYILFETGKSIPILQLSFMIKEACDKNSFFLNNPESLKSFDETGKLRCQSIYISDMPISVENIPRQICLNVYDEPYKYRLEEFEWDQLRNKYYAAIDFDFFIDKEDLLLKIVYLLLKTYPQAKFWCENKWFYTSEDLEKIINRPYDENWCYKDPKNL